MPKPDRFSHVNKTPNERSAYHRYIRQLGSQPTIEEPIDQDRSFDARQELAESTSTRERPLSASYQLREYFGKNWVGWVFGLLLTIASFLFIEVRVDIAVFKHDLLDQQQRLDKISTSMDKIGDSDHAQDLTIEDLKIRLEYLINPPPASPTQIAPSPTP